MCLSLMKIFRMGTMQKRKLSLFDVVDDSFALAKKANESLNGRNRMTPLINKSYEKLYSQRFWRSGRLLRYGIKKRGVPKLMISNHRRRHLDHLLSSPETS